MAIFDKIKSVFSPTPNIEEKEKIYGVLASYNQAVMPFIWGNWTNFIEDNDVVRMKERLHYKDYRSLLMDPHVYSCIQSRKSGVLSMEWRLKSVGDLPTDANTVNPVIDFLNTVFKNLDIHRIINEMLDAPAFGFVPLEIYYIEDGNYIMPVDIVGKPQEWFKCDNYKVFKFISQDATEGIALPNYKFLIVTHNGNYINPYGEKILSKCYWSTLFKKGGIELWAVFIEKFGMPFLHGKIEFGNNNSIQEVLKMLGELRQNGIMASSSDIEVDIKETSKGNTGVTVYAELVNMCNAEISKAILSQTLTTENSSGVGSFAMSQTHLAVRSDIVESDKYMVEQAFNKFIQYVVTLNFGAVPDIPTFELYEKTQVDLKRAQRDALLMNTKTISFTKDYYIRNYGVKEDEIIILSAPALNQINPTNPVTTFADSLKKNLSLTALAEMTQENIDKVVSLVDNSQTFDEVQTGLANIFPDLPTDKLESFFRQIMLYASVEGFLDGKFK